MSTTQAQVMQVLKDLIQEQGHVDPEVLRWITEIIPGTRLALPWARGNFASHRGRLPGAEELTRPSVNLTVAAVRWANISGAASEHWDWVIYPPGGIGLPDTTGRTFARKDSEQEADAALLRAGWLLL